MNFWIMSTDYRPYYNFDINSFTINLRGAWLLLIYLMTRPDHGWWCPRFLVSECDAERWLETCELGGHRAATDRRTTTEQPPQQQQQLQQHVTNNNRVWVSCYHVCCNNIDIMLIVKWDNLLPSLAQLNELNKVADSRCYAVGKYYHWDEIHI